MLGLDTNVLVRYLVRDDEAQFDKARKLIKRELAGDRRVFVSHLVLLETEWVLRCRYGLSKALVVETLSGFSMRPKFNSRTSQPLRKRFSPGKTRPPISPPRKHP